MDIIHKRTNKLNTGGQITEREREGEGEKIHITIRIDYPKKNIRLQVTGI